MNLTGTLGRAALLLSYLLFLQACSDGERAEVESPEAVETAGPAILDSSEAASISEKADLVTRIADQYYAYALEKTPEIAYFSGVYLPRHDGLEDNSFVARQARETVIDEWLSALGAVDADDLTSGGCRSSEIAASRSNTWLRARRVS